MTDLLSLSWLHAQHDLDLRTVVPADPDRGFSVIQPTELTDPREFLQPDAVVLTVGVALSREDGGTGRPPGTPGTADADTGDTTDPFPGYVARLAEAQVAAVGFGTGLFYPEVPPALVTAARAHGIAVFEVPRHTAFISVLNTVAEERARRAGRAQERLIAVQEQLSGAAVRGGLDALLTDTASHLAGAVAVTDDDGRVQGRVDRTVHPVTGHGVLLCAVDAAKGRTRSSAGQTGTGTDTRWRITQRMTRQGSRVHFITVLADHPFTPHDRSVLKHAAGLADILLQRPGYLRRERTELNSLALRLQLGLETTGFSTGQVLDQAADGDGRVRPTVVAADRVADQRRALTAADRRTAQDGRHLFTTELDTSTRLFLFRGSRTVDEIAATFGTAARRVRISVGEPVAWDDVSLDRVRRLETAARSLTPGSVAGPYEAGADWLSDTAVRTALDRRATETVDRLLTEGGADGPGGSDGSGGGRDLLQTLETWLRSGGRTGTAADLLGVHRHTVRTRLARIAGILEVDLDDPVVRAELLLVTVTRP